MLIFSGIKSVFQNFSHSYRPEEMMIDWVEPEIGGFALKAKQARGIMFEVVGREKSTTAGHQSKDIWSNEVLDS